MRPNSPNSPNMVSPSSIDSDGTLRYGDWHGVGIALPTDIPTEFIPYTSGSDYSGSLVEKSNYLAILDSIPSCYLYANRCQATDEHVACDAHHHDCDVCNGSGETNGPEGWIDCPRCDGDGRVCARGEIIPVWGSHGTFGLLYRDDEQTPEAIREILASLDSYALYDESHHSELEMKVVDRAWREDGSRDFRRELAALDVSTFCACECEDECDGTCTLAYLVEHWPEIVQHASDRALAAVWLAGCDTFNVNGGSGYENEQGDSIHFYIDEWIEQFAATPDRMLDLRPERATAADHLLANTSFLVGAAVPRADVEVDFAIEQFTRAVYWGGADTVEE